MKCFSCQSGSLCFSCGNYFCSSHGLLTLCKDCDSLEPFGDTYRFRLKNGTIIEDVSTLLDEELTWLVEAYGNRVKTLETLLAKTGREKIRVKLNSVGKNEDVKLQKLLKSGIPLNVALIILKGRKVK